MTAPSSFSPLRPPTHDPSDPVFRAHEGGKLGVHATQPLRDRADLALLYTPGVADVSRAIAVDPSLAARYTARSNTVAVVTDGTAVLGLGDIGPLAAHAGHGGQGGAVQALRRRGRRAGVHGDRHGRRARRGHRPHRAHVWRHQPRGHLGAAVLRDRAAAAGAAGHPGVPRRPARHGDRGARRPDRTPRGGGPIAGRRCASSSPAPARPAWRSPSCWPAPVSADIVVCDSRGIIAPTRADLADHKRRLAATTNPRGLSGALGGRAGRARTSSSGVSGGRCPRRTSPRWRRPAIIFALANPDPEVHPDVAARYAAVVATGRSDFPNQINNVLAFPGIFRGALDSGAPADHRGDEAGRRAGDRRPGARTRRPTRSCPACSTSGSARRGRGGGQARAGGPAVRRSSAAVPVG